MILVTQAPFDASSQQAPDVYVTSGWRRTWRQTDVAFLVENENRVDVNIWRWLNVGFWLHNLKTTKSQRQLTSVLDINLTLTLDVEFTLNFGHPTSQLKFNQIPTSYDIVCLLCACWDNIPTLRRSLHFLSCPWLLMHPFQQQHETVSELIFDPFWERSLIWCWLSVRHREPTTSKMSKRSEWMKRVLQTSL